LEEKLEGASPESLATLRADLAVLSRRAKLIGRAITLCTTTALLVCTVIAVLFLSAFLRFDAPIPVALLFIAAMLCFFPWLAVVPARDLSGNDEPAHRTTLNSEPPTNVHTSALISRSRDKIQFLVGWVERCGSAANLPRDRKDFLSY
jgi:hypothetical protein